MSHSQQARMDFIASAWINSLDPTPLAFRHTIADNGIQANLFSISQV